MAAAAAAPTTVVVDARYCAPEATAFAVARVIGSTDRDFAVTDAAGAVVMRVEGALFSFRRRTTLLDAARRPVLTMLDSTYLMSSRWDVFRGDSSSRRSLLFTAVKESVVQVRTKIFVYLAGYRSAEQVPDFVVGGSYYNGACTVFAGNSDSDDNAIAHITRQNLAGTLRGLTRHVYTARINPGIDQAFIQSLAVILHEMHHY
ncbi:protein LURP-one-related 10-like [Oryza brachyantha]|nr:protein LURP-one-related 10-like [Oryza brachyantha]